MANESSGKTVIQNQVSAADEILKLKSLLDSGILTQEEFDAKKKQLLNI
jgi:predicted Zn-dependent peptidase